MKGEDDVQHSPFGLLLFTQPLHSSEQHTRADLEFFSDFDYTLITNDVIVELAFVTKLP